MAVISRHLFFVTGNNFKQPKITSFLVSKGIAAVFQPIELEKLTFSLGLSLSSLNKILEQNTGNNENCNLHQNTGTS